MDALDKLELIIDSQTKEKKGDYKRWISKSTHSAIYVEGLNDEIRALEKVLTLIDEIKCHTPNMSDEMVLKMYGTER